MALTHLKVVAIQICLSLRVSDGAATNYPGCAMDMAFIISAAADVAQDLVYAVETCNPMWWTPPFAQGARLGVPPPNLFSGGFPLARRAGFIGSPNFGLQADTRPGNFGAAQRAYLLNQDFCASNLLNFFAKLSSLLASSVDAALKCGGADDTGCPTQVLRIISKVASATNDLTDASEDCQIGDRWGCAGDVFDSLADWVTAAQNLQTGVQLCDTTIDAFNAPEPIADDTTAPEPGAPEPEPNAGGKAVAPEPNAGAVGSLKAQFFPSSDASSQGLERRLKNILAYHAVTLPDKTTKKKIGFFTKEDKEQIHVMYDNLLEAMDDALATAHHRMQLASLFRGKDKEAWSDQQGLKLKARGGSDKGISPARIQR